MTGSSSVALGRCTYLRCGIVVVLGVQVGGHQVPVSAINALPATNADASLSFITVECYINQAVCLEQTLRCNWTIEVSALRLVPGFQGQQGDRGNIVNGYLPGHWYDIDLLQNDETPTSGTEICGQQPLSVHASLASPASRSPASRLTSKN